MKDNHHRQEREEMNELLRQYNNFKAGKKFNFIEEESFQRLIAYFDENDNLSSALEAVNFAIEQFPYSSSLFVKKADILIATQNYHEGLAILEKAEILDSNDINIYILKTDAYLALDYHQKATALLEEAIIVFDGEDKIELLFELADVYDDYEDFEKVFDCLQLILEQDPANEEALYKICFWADYTGRNEDSIRIHEKIIDEHPYSQLAWFNLGTAYQGLKLYEKSIDAYQYAIAIDEKFDYAYRNLGDAYLRLKRYRDAIEALQKVLELSMPEEVIYEAIGYCYDKLKNHAQARFNYRKAVHLNSTESRLYYKIAGTYMQEQYWESAVKNLESAMNINRSQPEFHFSLALCYIEMDRIKDAVIHFTHFIKARPRNVKGWKELIKCLYDAEYYEEALEQIYNAQKNTDNKPLFIYYKSAVLFELGKSKEALLQLEMAMKEAPSLVKQFVELNPSLLQHSAVLEIIGTYKNSIKRKKK
ncbi:MAG: tetratricopeptide repeat protein [Bacteroidota bacterium]|nr:tetratricopeptide repeat protein [Bacteroidota bacterium]